MKSIEQKVAAAVLGMIRKRREAASTPQSQVRTGPAGAIAPAKLREAQFSDFPAVAALKQRGGLNPDSVENWERLWRHNPALGMRGVERPIGWVLEAGGHIVGYLGNISLLYRFGDKTLTAVTAHGLVVDAPYRGVGITLVAAYFRQKDADLFIATSAIEAVGKIALAFKSSPVPQPEYDIALFWVLRPYPFARALMHKLTLAGTLATIGSAAASVAIGADGVLRKRRPTRTPNPFTVNEISISAIGDDFQTLWTAKQKEGRRLLADRSPSTLRWHFQIPGDRGSARALCCYQGPDIVGYTVVRTDMNAETGLRTSLIADMVARNDDPEIVRTLWAAVYDHAQHIGSHVLEVLGFPARIRNVGYEWNPYRRQYPACPFYYKAADPVLHKTLADGAAWYASPFDGDATLIRPSYPEPEPPRTSAMQVRNQEAQTENTASTICSDISEQEHTQVV